jgi:hypothetical protein
MLRLRTCSRDIGNESNISKRKELERERKEYSNIF